MDLSTLGVPGLKIERISGSEFARAPLHLPAWDGYLVKRWANTRTIADGTVLVDFACNSRCTREDWEPKIAAYHDLIERQYEIRDAITAAVIADISNLIGYLDPTDPGVPPIAAASPPGSSSSENPKSQIPYPISTDLRPYIGPSSISILDYEKNGLPYVEWFLNCTWDDEHGLAAVTHQSRLIDLDRGETDIYKIFADNGTLEAELKLAEQLRNRPKPTPPKPWWRFW
jgi:hypothetical protein